MYTHNAFVVTDYLQSCKQKKESPYVMNDFLKGREETSFEIFFKNFVPAIVAKQKFKCRLFSTEKQSIQMCTISDEAFTLLLLENNYDRWIDVYKNKYNNHPSLPNAEVAEDETRKRKWESDVSPKYTEGGIVYTDARKMTHRGWNDEGIRRFNALSIIVKQDRIANPKVLPESWFVLGKRVCIGRLRRL